MPASVMDRELAHEDSAPWTLTRLNDERRTWAADAWPEVERMARSFVRRNRLPSLLEDLVGASGEAVCRAAMSYDPAMGMSWRTWWTLKVRYAFMDTLRAIRGRRRALRSGEQKTRPWTCSLAVVSEENGHEDVNPVDRESPPVGWAFEYEDEIRALARVMPVRHGEFLRHLFLECRGRGNQGSVATMMGYESRTRGSQLYTQGLTIMREFATRREVFGIRRQPAGNESDGL